MGDGRPAGNGVGGLDRGAYPVHWPLVERSHPKSQGRGEDTRYHIKEGAFKWYILFFFRTLWFPYFESKTWQIIWCCKEFFVPLHIDKLECVLCQWLMQHALFVFLILWHRSVVVIVMDFGPVSLPSWHATLSYTLDRLLQSFWKYLLGDRI